MGVGESVHAAPEGPDKDRFNCDNEKWESLSDLKTQ